MDVNEELKLLWKCNKNNIGGVVEGGGSGWGVRVDENEEVKLL